jgi:hypothetical protein
MTLEHTDAKYNQKRILHGKDSEVTKISFPGACAECCRKSSNIPIFSIYNKAIVKFVYTYICRDCANKLDYVEPSTLLKINSL